MKEMSDTASTIHIVKQFFLKFSLVVAFLLSNHLLENRHEIRNALNRKLWAGNVDDAVS